VIGIDVEDEVQGPLRVTLSCALLRKSTKALCGRSDQDFECRWMLKAPIKFIQGEYTVVSNLLELATILANQCLKDVIPQA
jgi:hypothetical protein